jgi:diguanylate cyclase (GGDEF)-like protein
MIGLGTTPLQTLRAVLMRSSRTFVWSMTALGLVLLLSFISAIGYNFYLDTIQINEQAASNIASLTEQDIGRTLDLYDLSLQAVLDGVGDQEVMSQSPALRQKILFDRSATARGLGALVALDRNGQIFADSLAANPRNGNFGDREYFIAQRDAVNDIGLYISRPFRARLQGGKWCLSISRSIRRPDGSFDGIVSGTIRLSYFQLLFGRISLGVGGSIALLRDDGTLIVGTTADDDKIGTGWRGGPVFANLPDSKDGSFVSDRSIDGIKRLYAFRRIGELPLVVVVGLPTSQVLALWWSKMLILAAVFVVTAGCVLVLVWMLEAELRRRAIAEMAAAELARTDGLTKVANRRWFDEELSRNLGLAARDGGPMSCLMIDVDFFKLFNDTYGHQAGDGALVAIAGVIKDAIKRPGDLAARYGGEEFAVLLLNTDQRGAAQIATVIRDGVRSLQIDHAASEHKIATVSIGVATTAPRSGIATDLVSDADAALYYAKEHGRNRVSTSNVVVAGFEPLARRAN